MTGQDRTGDRTCQDRGQDRAVAMTGPDITGQDRTGHGIGQDHGKS